MITKIALGSLILIVILAPAAFMMAQQIAKLPSPPPTASPPPFQDNEIARIEQAIREAIESEKELVPLFFMYENQIDHITISQDGNWATAWITPLDPETNQVVPTEPGLVILQLVDGNWKVTLPSDPEWVLTATTAPDDLISEDVKAAIQEFDEISAEALPSAPITGYFLPWAGGDTMYLTQSVGHDRYTPSGNAHYAFDFAKPGYPSGMFNVLASRSGIVKQAVWTYPNGNEDNSNYLVLEDTTTIPTTYQLYLHLAQNSIPPELRAVGAHVRQGQFIGIADDTGASSGNHLHFMVHTYPLSYWGRSIDITFVEVSINGGRPRIRSDLAYCRDDDVCDQTQTAYVSRNFLNPDFTPPSGGILNPIQGATISTSILRLDGWATDDSSGLASAQFIAHYEGGWRPIGDPYNTPTFSLNWDLCAGGVPDGPISLALQIRDKAFNQASGLPGLIHVIKNYTCPPPPPACVPNSNQVALFADPDFSGSCVVLGTGSFTSAASFGDLGVDNAASLQVGANVQPTFYMNSTLQGRGETFVLNDSNLADNRIGVNTVSSVLVQTRSTAPAVPRIVWPPDNAAFPGDASFSLAWDNGGSTLQYQARLLSGAIEVRSLPWQTEPVWHLNSLPVGTYTWQVKAKSGALESSWSTARTLQIQTASPGSTTTISAPFIDNMETLAPYWTNSGNWDLTDEINHTDGGHVSLKYDTSSRQGYDTGSPNSGYLTSPPIQLPGSPAYSLRFWYYYETEGPGLHWDQRWVQISVDGGAYTNLLQLSDDAPNFWHQSPVISLASYAGHKIQVRYYFATQDSALNTFRGWFIDDFGITLEAPPDCQDTDGNSFIQAVPINVGDSTSAEICPAGELDFYKFQGITGDQIGIQIQAQALNSALDSYLYLLDVDGRSVLAENDDLVLGERTDSWLTYRLRRTGTYFVKVRSWDHPSSGGHDFNYNLRLVRDNEDPLATFAYPLEGRSVTKSMINLDVAAYDSSSGVSHVQFLWHSGDWEGADWVVLGEDWDGSDGWKFSFDASGLPNLYGMAFHARVYDWAGNWIGVGVWNLKGPAIYLPIVVNRR